MTANQATVPTRHAIGRFELEQLRTWMVTPASSEGHAACVEAPGLVAKVVPLVVLTLLKIVSYLDQPAVRQKDLDDIAAIVEVYADDGET
jgi:hypothetical protein